jgi:hypothetical protein
VGKDVQSSRLLLGAVSFTLMIVAAQLLTETTASSLTMSEKNGVGPSSAMATLVQVTPDEFSVSDAAGQDGQRISLNIKSNPGAPPEDLFAITGLPPEVKLSAGSAYDDFWLVRRKELQSLTMITPDGFSRKFQIAITRVRSANRAPVTATMNVQITNKSVGASPVQPAPSARSNSAYNRTSNETVLLEKAREKFKKGDVSGARSVFEFLAMKGDPESAIAMGETYDPVVLGQLYVKGLQPDEAKAVAWYKKAEQLGDQGARIRLNALNQN